MDKLTTLIVVVIVLVTALGIGAFLLGGYLSPHNNTTNLTNQTNISVNNTTTNNQTNKSNYISASRAIAIAKSAAAYYPDNRTRFTAEFVDGNPPYWRVIAWNNVPTSPNYNLAIGGAKINAITGELISAHG